VFPERFPEDSKRTLELAICRERKGGRGAGGDLATLELAGISQLAE
jgi:hypothetical protein